MEGTSHQSFPLDRHLSMMRIVLHSRESLPITRRRADRRHGEGLTIVELLVAVFLLAIGLIASFALFTATVQQMRRTTQRNEAQAAVERDISLIQQGNDRYSCQSIPCDVAGADLNEDQYAPNPETDLATFNAFRDLCTDEGLLDDLFAWIAAQDNPPDANGDPMRQPPARITADNEPYPYVVGDSVSASNRYQVRWIANDSAGNQIVNRTIVLTPTVASWCPGPPASPPAT